MFASKAVAALVLAASAGSVDANAFLEARADAQITKQDVEETLLAELSRVASSSQALLDIEDELRPMFVALPKNRHGSLESSVVRYALHRYFVQKHGWYMTGLDPAGAALSSTAPSSIMKDRAPAYIQSLFEERMQGRGLGLRELAVFAASLSDLVHKEAMGGLHRVYTSLRLPTIGFVPHRWAESAIKAYIIEHIIGGNLTITSLEDFEFLESALTEIYPDWPGTYMWVEDLRQTHELQLQPRQNPFVPGRDSFDKSATFVQELGHHFGAFQDLECRALKGRLVDMEYQGTGRIRLSRFYAGAVDGDWTLSESVEYLRNLGVLDETDPSSPSVVIPNYMTSRTNCLTASGFYSVCCFDECEGLLQQVERDVAGPGATPALIVQSVSALHSDTVDAPRNLSSTLLTRLDDIAKLHRGKVPLHGRLFAQWMHHAYPRECPFPHVSGTHNPMTPDDWMAQHGLDNVEASMEEMQAHHARLESEASPSEPVQLPWSLEEELVVGADDWDSEAGSYSFSRLLRLAMALLALGSFAVPLVRASQAVVAGSPRSDALEKVLV